MNHLHYSFLLKLIRLLPQWKQVFSVVPGFIVLTVQLVPFLPWSIIFLSSLEAACFFPPWSRCSFPSLKKVVAFLREAEVPWSQEAVWSFSPQKQLVPLLPRSSLFLFSVKQMFISSLEAAYSFPHEADVPLLPRSSLFLSSLEAGCCFPPWSRCSLIPRSSLIFFSPEAACSSPP